MITPCLAICKVDNQTLVCRACGRTREQIQKWSTYTDDERLNIMRQLGYANKRMGREERLRRYDRG